MPTPLPGAPPTFLTHPRPVPGRPRSTCKVSALQILKTPVPLRFRSGSTPVPLRFRSGFAPVPIRFRSGSAFYIGKGGLFRTTLCSENAVSRRERLQWSSLWLSLETRVSGRMNVPWIVGVDVVRLDRIADMVCCLISVEWSFVSLGIWRTGVRILSTVQLSGIDWR